MKLLLRRIALRDTYTIGHLYINGVYFCDTLEDKVRNLDDESKVYGETAIPYGTYNVVIDYSSHFKRMMPHILNVKYLLVFDFIGAILHGIHLAVF
jgi:hypothetical protein